MKIRKFQPGDEMSLLDVFHAAVHGIASQDYTAEQIQAWAPAAMDRELWIKRMRGIQPFVVESEGRTVAYADVQADGYIDHFFVSPAVARTGVGTLLMGRLHEVARAQGIAVLTSDVSRTAQPFFARFGFVVVEQRLPIVRDVVVPNARMRCELAAGSSFEPGHPSRSD